MMRRAVVVLVALTLSACSGSTTAPSAPAPSTPPVVVPTPAPPPIIRGPSFSQDFWNQFVYNGFEAPTAMQPLRRWTVAPKLYLKTVDEAGQAIDFATLNIVQTAMRDVAATWGGGQFGLASIEQGTGTREGQAGWITVKWSSANVGSFCGRSDVAVDGGMIDLNYRNPSCSCGVSKIYARLARHELGHAFGYWHTDDPNDAMYGQQLQTIAQCDGQPSAREAYHATIAYQTPVGTTTALPRYSAPIIID